MSKIEDAYALAIQLHQLLSELAKTSTTIEKATQQADDLVRTIGRHWGDID